jgi:chaperonin GroES
MNFEPLGKRVLITRVEEAKTTESGIILQQIRDEKNKPSIGTVVSVSKEIDNISIGDTIIFGKASGTPIVLEDKPYIIIHFDELLGTI